MAKKRNGRKIIVDGVEYNYLTDAYEAHKDDVEVPYNSVKARFYQYNFSAEEALFLKKYQRRKDAS